MQDAPEVICSCLCIRGRTMHVCLIIDKNFCHLVKMVFVEFSYHRVTIFPFMIKKKKKTLSQRKYLETMQMSYFSSGFLPLVLASVEAETLPATAIAMVF